MSYDNKYNSSASSMSNVRSVSPMRPVNTSLYKEPESDYCRRCNKYIYPLEMMGPVMGYKYHKLCFRCHVCERQLDFKNYRTNLIDLNDREIYCTAHNPRNGAFNDHVYGYNARTKSPGDIQVTEFSSSSSEYYKMQQKSSEHLDSVGRSRSPYGGYVNLPRDYSTDVTPTTVVVGGGGSNMGWGGNGNKYSRSTEQLDQDRAGLALGAGSTLVQQHHYHHHHHQEFSSSNMGAAAATGSGGGIAVVPNEYYLNPSNVSAINNIQVLPSSNLDRYQYEKYDNNRDGYTSGGRYQTDSGSRNIVVDVISQHDDSDDTDNSNFNNNNNGRYNNNGSNYAYTNNNNYSDHHRTTGISSDAVVSSPGASYGGSSSSYSSSNDSSSASYNLRAIVSEAMSHDRNHAANQQQQRPASFYPGAASSTSYERSNSSHGSSSTSNLKNIYAEASMTAALRSPTTPQLPDFYPPPPHTPQTPQQQLPGVASGANLKNIYQEAVNQHYHRSMSNSSLVAGDYGESGKNSNLKRIFSEASEVAASPSRAVALDDRVSNMKRIVNEAAITNSLADKIATANNKVYGSAGYGTSDQHVIAGQHHHHVHEFSSSSSSSEFNRQVISTSEQTTTVQQQQQHFHASSSTQSMSGSPSLIGRPAINNQITMPVDSCVDRKSHLVNIMSDVMATNSSAYDPSHANRFTFTGPNANLKSIVAEAADYNARVAPTSHNMYHSLRDAAPNDIHPSNILGENKGFGMARLTVHYDQLRSRLSVTVHEARHLKNLDKKTVSDPYARVYLAPDGKPSYKRKTKIIKNNLNPVWQETFDYPMPLNEALSKVLTINLKDERGFFEKQEGQFLGEVVIPLNSVKNLTEPLTKWFYLQPLKLNSNILANVSYF